MYTQLEQRFFSQTGIAFSGSVDEDLKLAKAIVLRRRGKMRKRGIGTMLELQPLPSLSHLESLFDCHDSHLQRLKDVCSSSAGPFLNLP